MLGTKLRVGGLGYVHHNIGLERVGIEWNTLKRHHLSSFDHNTC